MWERDKPKAPCRVLLPKVVGSGREWRKCWQSCLKVSGISECARGPFALQEVQPWGESRWQTFTPTCQRGQLCGEVEIPLRCWVTDSCGSLHTGTATLLVDACVRTEGPADGLAGCQWILQSCVRMLCPPVRSSSLCFETELEVLLELDAVRWQRFACRKEAPCCPDLPLYPPPCR